jgi:hypothetical protein
LSLTYLLHTPMLPQPPKDKNHPKNPPGKKPSQGRFPHPPHRQGRFSDSVPNPVPTHSQLNPPTPNPQPPTPTNLTHLISLLHFPSLLSPVKTPATLF